mgnify:FL=1
MEAKQWWEYYTKLNIHQFNPFNSPQSQNIRSFKGTAGHNFAHDRNKKTINIYAVS